MEPFAMFFWEPILLLLGLATGWRFASFSFADKSLRLLLTPLIGLALPTALFWIADQAFAQTTSGVLCLVGLGLALALTPKPSEDSRLSVAAPGRWSLFGIALLALSAWLFAIGTLQLSPPPEFLIWDLNLTEPGQRSAFMASTALFPGDAWMASLLSAGLCQVAVAMGAFAVFRLLYTDANRAWQVGGLYLLGCSQYGWLVFEAPSEVLLHLWTLSALFLITNPRRHTLFAATWLLGALATLSWPIALALPVATTDWKLPSTLKSAFKPLLVVAFCLNGSLYGFTIGLLIASLLILKNILEPGWMRTSSVKLCLLELLGPSQGVLGLTALAVETTRRLESYWAQSEPQRFRIGPDGLILPKRALLTAAGVLTLWLGFDGAERVINDTILIGAQREGVQHVSLLRPRSLRGWLEWRGSEFGFTEREWQALRSITPETGRFAYLSGPLPDPRASSLLALLDGQPLAGWSSADGGVMIDRELGVFQFTDNPQSLEGLETHTVLRGGKDPVVVPKTRAHKTSTNGMKVLLSPEKGAPLSIDSPLTADLTPDQSREVPVASLIPITVILTNTTQLELDLSVYKGIRFQPTFLERKPEQPIDQPAAAIHLSKLGPGRSTSVTGYLRTANQPLDYNLEIVLSKADGTFNPVPLKQPFLIRSWRVELPLDQPYGEEL